MSQPMRRGYVRARHFALRVRSFVHKPRTVRQLQAVPLSEIEPCPNPVVIAGIHRSGTSLLRRVLDSHPSIACPPESYFLQAFTSMLDDRDVGAGLAGFGFPDDEHAALIRAWATQFHEAFRAARGKPRWADKTPQYTAILPSLRRLLGADAQFVVITRNPLDVTHSIASRGWRLAELDPDPVLNAAMYVAERMRLVQAFEAEDDGTVRLSYEQLVAHPERELRRVLDFLGEPWVPDVLEHHRFEHNFGTEDPVVRGLTGFHSNSGNWRALPPDALSAIVPILRTPAAQWGYDLDADLGP